MKKNLKRTLAKVMVFALTVTLAGTATDADAAKKIKLSKKSITITKGKSKKVTIKNVKAKKVKKLTVKSNKKKIATVKKTGNKKTAFKVTGKKKGSAKITVTVKVKGKKKATKLTLKVKVKNAAVKKTAAPATQAPSQAPTNAPSNAPSQAPTNAPSNAPTNTPSNEPGDPTPTPYEAVAPTQPEKPSTPAKVLPELNLREEAATDWAKGGSYGTAIFNTDDTVTYNSEPWAAEGTVKKAGSCYNNGIAWYIDAASKGTVDLSAYDSVELTIKTDAEVKMMTWAGTADASSFWEKNDTWGGSSSTVENEDGSKTITYSLAKIFGNAKKVAKASAIGFTLKSGVAGDTSDDPAFEAKEAVVYGIKFVTAENPDVETGKTETGSTETGSTETGKTETGSTEVPTPTPVVPSPSPVVPSPTQTPEAKPLVTLTSNGYTSFEDMGVDFDATKTYSAITLKIKAYNINDELVTAEDENYSAFAGYSKVSIGNSENTTDANGNVGCGNGAGGNTSDYSSVWGYYMLNNLGKYGVYVDDEGYFTLNISMYDATNQVNVDSANYDGVGFQTTTNEAGIPKIEIYDITFTEAE